jgi:hypothetical protein
MTDGSGQQADVAGSMEYLGLAGLAAALLILLVLVLVIARRGRGREEGEETLSPSDYAMDQVVSEYEYAEQVDTEVLQGTVAEDGYEWLESPPGSGLWYYRDADNGEWIAWETN